MSEIVYKVIVCRNNGEEPFYIKVKDSGEFADNEFANEEFKFHHDATVQEGYNMMLDDKCVLVFQRLDDAPRYIASKITEDLTFSINNIKVFKTCAECNKKGMSLTLQDGTVLYPENTDDYEGFENSVVKIEYNGQIICAKVGTYKFHTKEHSRAIELKEGCFRNFNKCVSKSEDDCIESGRKVKPDRLTKKLSRC